MSGFGAGLLLSAYLLPLLGAQVTVPLLAVTMLVTNLGRFWAFRAGGVAPRAALPILLGLLPAAWLASGAFARLSGPLADLVVGLFLVASLPLRRGLAGRQAIGTAPVLVAGGAVTGTISGVTTGAGMLLIPLLLGAGLAKGALIATDSLVSAAMHAARLGGYARAGLLPGELLLLGVALGLASVPGSRAAAWIVERLSPRLHTLWLEMLVGAIGLSTAGAGAWALWRGAG